jgi:hypothetical protein
MTTSYGHDQDADPPTSDDQLPPEAGDDSGGKESGSHPDPDPGPPADESSTSSGADS